MCDLRNLLEASLIRASGPWQAALRRWRGKHVGAVPSLVSHLVLCFAVEYWVWSSSQSLALSVRIVDVFDGP